jgi:hypothetical protein
MYTGNAYTDSGQRRRPLTPEELLKLQNKYDAQKIVQGQQWQSGENAATRTGQENMQRRALTGATLAGGVSSGNLDPREALGLLNGDQSASSATPRRRIPPGWSATETDYAEKVQGNLGASSPAEANQMIQQRRRGADERYNRNAASVTPTATVSRLLNPGEQAQPEDTYTLPTRGPLTPEQADTFARMRTGAVQGMNQVKEDIRGLKYLRGPANPGYSSPQGGRTEAGETTDASVERFRRGGYLPQPGELNADFRQRQQTAQGDIIDRRTIPAMWDIATSPSASPANKAEMGRQYTGAAVRQGLAQRGFTPQEVATIPGQPQAGELPRRSPPVPAEMREPYPSENEYFKGHPETAGMAAEDNRVILNPYSKLSDAQRSSVVTNERARIGMRISGNRPNFEITPEQRAAFSGYGSDQDIKETIAARIASGDPSAGNITPEQRAWAESNLTGVTSRTDIGPETMSGLPRRPLPELTDAERQGIAGEVSQRGVAAPVQEGLPPGMTPEDYAVAKRAGPDALNRAGITAGSSERQAAGMTGGYYVPRTLPVNIGGQDMPIRNAYAGMSGPEQQKAEQERQARLYVGELQQSGKTPQEIDQLVAQRFPLATPNFYSRSVGPTPTETAVAQRPLPQAQTGQPAQRSALNPNDLRKARETTAADYFAKSNNPQFTPEEQKWHGQVARAIVNGQDEQTALAQNPKPPGMAIKEQARAQAATAPIPDVGPIVSRLYRAHAGDWTPTNISTYAEDFKSDKDAQAWVDSLVRAQVQDGNTLEQIQNFVAAKIDMNYLSITLNSELAKNVAETARQMARNTYELLINQPSQPTQAPAKG